MVLKRFLLGLLLLSGTVFGKEFSVSTTAELRTALTVAEDNNEDDVITLAKGIYSTATDGLGTFEFNSTESYDLEIKALDNLKSSDVIISGNSANRVFTIKNRGKATLNRVTVANGYSDDGYAGGVWTDSKLFILNSFFNQNKSYREISYSAFAYGGAIYGTLDSYIVVINSKFSMNSSYAYTTCSCRYDSSNSYSYGGAIYSLGMVEVFNSIFNINRAGGVANDGSEYSYGGAIFSNGNLNIFNSIFTDNKANSESNSLKYGGAIYHKNQNCSLINSIFQKNSAYYGNDIYLDKSSSQFYSNHIEWSNIYNTNNIIAESGNFFDGNITLSPTFQLESNSSLKDMGSNLNNYLPYTQMALYPELQKYLSTDGYCNSRVEGSEVDIGAFEIGGAEDYNCYEEKVETNSSTLSNIEVLLYGNSQCPYGGTKVESGYDININGTLDESEVEKTEYICLGEDNSTVETRYVYENMNITEYNSFASSETCPNGGLTIKTGTDKNLNKKIDSDEINDVFNICNGKNGSDTAINSLIKTSSENSCSNGGFKIETGFDLNSDGVLQSSEVTGSSKICNGVKGDEGQDGENGVDGTNGKNSLIKTSIAENCPNGGIKIETGLDLNSDGVLQSNETTNSSEVCNGEVTKVEFEENVVDENLTQIEISQGWNLIAIDSNLSKLSNEISIVWKFSDGNWSAFSPNGEFTSAISDHGVSTISESLSSKNGVWVLSNSDTSLKNFSPEKSNDKPNFPNISGKMGWNLMGTDRTIPAQALTCSEGEKRNVWKYVENQWLLFVENVDVKQYPNMFEKIHAGQGFWLQCQ
jgi:hypothetical protein